MVYKCSDKNTSGGSATLARSETLSMRCKSAVKNENMLSKELSGELHKSIIQEN